MGGVASVVGGGGGGSDESRPRGSFPARFVFPIER